MYRSPFNHRRSAGILLLYAAAATLLALLFSSCSGTRPRVQVETIYVTATRVIQPRNIHEESNRPIVVIYWSNGYQSTVHGQHPRVGDSTTVTTYIYNK